MLDSTHEAQKPEKWRKVMQEDIDSIEKYRFTPEQKPIGVK